MTTVINSTNNGTPVLSYTNEVNKIVDDYEINTMSAVAATQHVLIKSSGTDCGACKVSNVLSRTTAKTLSAGQVVMIGADTSYTGNQKNNDSIIEYCDAFGAYYFDPSISANTGCHAFEIGWNLRPTIQHCRATGFDYGVVLKGGAYDSAGEGGAVGNILYNLGSALRSPSDGIVIKGLQNIPVCHNFIYQPRTKPFTFGAVSSRLEGGTHASGDIFFQNNVVILDIEGLIFSITSGSIKYPRKNLYYAAQSTAFNGVNWATWLTNGKATDADFEKGSIYIRNPSFGTTWEVYGDAGTLLETLNYNPLANHFKNIGDPRWLEESLYLKTGYLSGYVDYALKDFYGGKMFAVPNIGPDQGTGAGFGPWTTFDATMPALALSPDAPGTLLEVQEWSKANVTKKQIDKVSK